jgi:hypothetical protein
VSGLGGAVTSAKRRLYGVDPSDTGGQVRSVTGSWSESTVTWNNSPIFGASTVSSVGSVSTGQWYEWDVTPLVTGSGTFTLGMVSSSTNGADYTSREGISAQRPQLVVTTS